mgnify:FL=1
MFTTCLVRKYLPGIAASLVIGLCATLVISAQVPQKDADIGITALQPPGAPDGMAVAGLRSHQAITLLVPKLDPRQDTLKPQDFTLQSDHDPAYRESQPAARLGLDRQVTGFVDDHTAITETRVHLLFPHALQDGLSYRLHAPAVGLANMPVTWKADQPSGSIQLNQVGYLPAARKLAYIGNWLGDAGPMPVDATDYSVIDTDTGDTLLQGKLELRAADDPWSGNDIYLADFSALQKTGDYRLRVAGLGLSDSFRIAPDVYDACLLYTSDAADDRPRV